MIKEEARAAADAIKTAFSAARRGDRNPGTMVSACRAAGVSLKDFIVVPDFSRPTVRAFPSKEDLEQAASTIHSRGADFQIDQCSSVVLEVSEEALSVCTGKELCAAALSVFDTKFFLGKCQIGSDPAMLIASTVLKKTGLDAGEVAVPAGIFLLMAVYAGRQFGRSQPRQSGFPARMGCLKAEESAFTKFQAGARSLQVPWPEGGLPFCRKGSLREAVAAMRESDPSPFVRAVLDSVDSAIPASPFSLRRAAQH